MTILEIINILKWAENCGEVESKQKGFKVWHHAVKPEWNFGDFDYRKKEMQPTHKEIMTKWWLCKSGWKKVIKYNNKEECAYFLSLGNQVNKRYFYNLKSADMPSEDQE